MAETPDATIRAAAEAYVAGDEDGLFEQMHDGVHVLGSEQLENWSGNEQARHGMRGELQRLLPDGPGSVSGELVERALNPEVEDFQQSDEMAWWSVTADVTLDGRYYREASWTTVLARHAKDWQIVHSHFSIHR
jgi:hypothetical protein